ncbi:malto-oligosyltrehalose trehalohydrolase [Tessaracoccus oleiagri]|uniref:Malto-oligosyltrehalose trehalohydrolase n=1 Tax=Tessaracoccus oleiagri TaxID=686624 RepID=A0A1G9H896_9ACTN|nr:malto-oligosyltrehalose trehalohydrolase [Tessaracoccus oleiagri]SDL09160.1 maltooligosyltrehalose trehalohydrolase [Tessaracoccus oleiagri]
MRDITRPEVWAPNAERVELSVNAGMRSMERGAGGWWRAEPLAPGDRYGFRLDGGPVRPDPRSLHQPDGPHGESRIVDPAVFDRPRWEGVELRGKALYELHVGTFTAGGTFDDAIGQLDHLVELGVGGVELLPVNDFAGRRGWGYDGVGQYATHDAYGGPEAFVRFVDACHARGLGVVLDVVYNHFGPEGNYLAEFGPYFTDRHETPWGPAVNLDDEGSREVRDFLLGAMHQWVFLFGIDGFRIDAVHAFQDDSDYHFLAEIADRAREWEAQLGRPLFVTAESDLNQPAMVSPTGSSPDARGMDAQWADDVHHALHSFFTGERQGYYVDFGSVDVLAKALTEVFVHDGGHSTFRDKAWGTPVDRDSDLYDGHSFVVFIQNHDQVGNRAVGDRVGQSLEPGAYAAAAALYLLGPFTPLVFMGEEWNATSRFPFFSHLGPELGPHVTAGRAREFEAMGWADTVPDPQAESTFINSKLRWEEVSQRSHQRVFDWYRTLLRLRRELPGAMDPSLSATHAEIVDDDTLVLHRPGFAVAVTRAEREVDVPLTGDVLAAWDEPRRLDDGRLAIPGPGVVIVAE